MIIHPLLLPKFNKRCHKLTGLSSLAIAHTCTSVLTTVHKFSYGAAQYSSDNLFILQNNHRSRCFLEAIGH